MWKWSYGKHDEQDFNRVENCLGGNYIRWNFLDCENPGGNFLGGNFSGGSYPGWEFFGWELSEWELSWVGIFQVGVTLGGNFLGGNCLGGNCSGWSYPWWKFSLVVVFRVGVFLVPNDASTKSDQNITKDLWIAFAWFLKNLKIYYNLPRI